MVNAADAHKAPTGNWEPYTTQRAWRLAEGDGTRSVWVEYRDYVGNESMAYEDTIILDTLPPSGEIYTISESSPYAHSTGNTVYYGDGGSGQFQVQVQATDERSGLERDMTTNKED